VVVDGLDKLAPGMKVAPGEAGPARTPGAPAAAKP
jgi:hypothetical protein